MKVMKFGGTSVGSAQRIKKVAELVSRGGRNIVVLSAMSGTTNSLVEITEYLFNRNPDGASETIDRLAAKSRATIAELFGTAETKEQAQNYVDGVFDYLRTFAKKLFTQVEAKIIIGQGELLSTKLMELYLHEQGVAVQMLPALDFMKIDMQGEPDAEIGKIDKKVH